MVFPPWLKVASINGFPIIDQRGKNAIVQQRLRKNNRPPALGPGDGPVPSLLPREPPKKRTRKRYYLVPLLLARHKKANPAATAPAPALVAQELCNFTLRKNHAADHADQRRRG
jgi:hypothetical protein